jgi:ubiquinone/menaquinone biosynthesis C-methylase UbiE
MKEKDQAYLIQALKTQGKINEAYNASAAQYVIKCFDELTYKPLDRDLLDRFAKMTSGKGKVCDLGCGPGQTTQYLKSRDADVIGVDASENMIIEAKKLNPSIDYVVDDMFHLKFDKESFFGVSSFYAFVNFKIGDLSCLFQEYYRILKDQGLVLMAFHTGEEKVHVDSFFESGKPLDFYYFNELEVIHLLKEAGFEVLEAFVRYPYKEEYPSKRAYILAEKNEG